jgi:hypothetical protein
LTQLEELETVDVQGKWVTPGIVDAHSHLGVGSAPQLSGMPLCIPLNSAPPFLTVYRRHRFQLAQRTHSSVAPEHRRAQHPRFGLPAVHVGRSHDSPDCPGQRK